MRKVAESAVVWSATPHVDALPRHCTATVKQGDTLAVTIALLYFHRCRSASQPTLLMTGISAKPSIPTS